MLEETWNWIRLRGEFLPAIAMALKTNHTFVLVSRLFYLIKGLKFPSVLVKKEIIMSLTLGQRFGAQKRSVSQIWRQFSLPLSMKSCVAICIFTFKTNCVWIMDLSLHFSLPPSAKSCVTICIFILKEIWIYLLEFIYLK